MRRLKLMRKGFVLAALLPILALVSTVSMTGAKGPKPPTPSDTRLVIFEGSDITGENTLTADSRGRDFRLYTPVGEDETTTLRFEETSPDLWRNDSSGDYFAGTKEDGDLLIQIDERTQEAYIEYWFGRYTEVDVKNGEIHERYEGWYKYQLAGTGVWNGESAPDGTIEVAERTFTICQLIWEASTKKSGKSATGVRIPQLWAGQLDFTVEIEP